MEHPDARPSLRPRNYVTPPPDPAEALYYEGMAAYQHRNWEEALARFSRLKVLQPTRPGLDALLDETRWFLQLQAAAPQPPADSLAGPLARRDASPAPRPRWQTWGLIALGLIGIVAIALIALQGRVPWVNAADREAQDLYHRGQARLQVGDYEGAYGAFKKLLELTPNDPEARLGLTRAERMQTLAQGYAAAEAAIALENWDAAAEELRKVLALDGSYADAQAKADFVAQRRRLAGLYGDGSRLYDLGQWAEAIGQFEKIRELDASYRTEAVAQFLFVCYLNAGQSLIENAESQTPQVQRAVEYFSRALALLPRNRAAADARRLGSLYLDATRALAAGNTAEAQTRLEVLLGEAPTYANGQAARQLYALLLKRGQAAAQTGDISAAVRYYQQAQNVPVADHTAAIAGEAYARAITPTPTPAPTATPRPTSPSPTATPYAVVRSAALNLRAGPGLGYPILDQVVAGDALTLTGRNADGDWLQVCCVAGQSGWVAAEWVELRGAAAAVAIITPSPPPTLVPAARPPTPSGQMICLTGQVRDTHGGRPLSGWTILLTPPNGVTRARVTDADGYYRYGDLTAGVYTVSERLEVGWRAISPQSSLVVITRGAACQVMDFWNERWDAQGGPPATPQPTDTPVPAPTATPPR